MFDAEIKKLWLNVYEDDGDGSGAGDGGTGNGGGSAGTGDGTGGTGSGTAGDGTGDTGGKGTTKQFSQDEVNRILAQDRRKHDDRYKKAIDELEALKTKTTLSADERKQLEERIEHMNNDLLTKEQLAQKEKQKMEKGYKKQVEDLTSDRDGWKHRYINETITRSIVDAAVVSEAYRPEQIVAIVRPNTQLAEELDADGKPTGNYIPKVELRDVDKDGKPVTLQLSPTEAVKRMKEMDDYLNLFKGEGTGGLGGTNRGGVEKKSLKELAKDPKKYREARKAGKVSFQ